MNSPLEGRIAIPAIELSNLQKKLETLTTDKTNPSVTKEDFYEQCFQSAKELENLRKNYPVNPLKKKISELQQKLYKLNPRLPRLAQLTKLFGPEAIKETFKSTISSLYQTYSRETNQRKNH